MAQFNRYQEHPVAMTFQFTQQMLTLQSASQPFQAFLDDYQRAIKHAHLKYTHTLHIFPVSRHHSELNFGFFEEFGWDGRNPLESYGFKSLHFMSQAMGCVLMWAHKAPFVFFEPDKPKTEWFDAMNVVHIVNKRHLEKVDQRVLDGMPLPQWTQSHNTFLKYGFKTILQFLWTVKQMRLPLQGILGFTAPYPIRRHWWKRVTTSLEVMDGGLKDASLVLTGNP